jgi:8-oxo-dGTP diphosphatase
VVVDKGFVPGNEVDDIVWLPIDDAARHATHPLDQDLIMCASGPIATPFVLLRHGHAAKRAAWSGDDVDRPLDPGGVAQADALVTRLSAYGIERIHTSAARRCVQTICPYADASGHPVVPELALTEHAFGDAPDVAKQQVAGLLEDAVRSGEPTVVCVHRPYLPDLIDYLIEGTGLERPPEAVPVGSMVVLHCVAEPAREPRGDKRQRALRVVALEHHRL